MSADAGAAPRGMPQEFVGRRPDKLLKEFVGSRSEKLLAVAFHRAVWAVWAGWSLATGVPGWAAEIPDTERGRALYENH